METIKMSTMERKRMTLMTRVVEGLLKLREAAEMMRVSYRQARRILRRYQPRGGRRACASGPRAEVEPETAR